MKKIAFIALVALLTGAFAFADGMDYSAKTWTNDIGISLGIPVSQYKADGNKLNQWGITFDLMYLGVHRNGFTVKVVSGGGTASSGNLDFKDEDGRQFGSFTRSDLGLGYSFVHDNDFTISALAMFGVESTTYETDSKSYTHDELGDVDRSYTATLYGINVGVDIMAALYTREHFGYFASLSARFIPLAGLSSGVKYVDGDFTRTDTTSKTGHGVFSITPAVGVVWRF